MAKTEHNKILASIHTSLDKVVQMGQKYQDHSPSELLDELYPVRITLAAHYNILPYEEARKCRERLEIVNGIVQDILERKRIEEIIKWRT